MYQLTITQVLPCYF